MRRVLGIDPGSVNCGYGIVEQDGASIRHVDSGAIKATASKGKWVRIGQLGNALYELLADHVWGLDDVCGFESAYVPVGRTNGVETLAEARGALVYVCLMLGLSIVTVAPSTVKKAVTGNGRAEKEQVAKVLGLRLGLRDLLLGDQADALGVAVAVAQGAGS